MRTAGFLLGVLCSVLVWCAPRAQAQCEDEFTEGHRHGWWTSVDGDTAAVVGDSSTYLYERSELGWQLVTEIPIESFGVSVNGDRVGVGVPDVSSPGEVHVFQRSGTAWILTGLLVAPDGEVGDHFGDSLAIDGDTIVVGAWGDDAQRGSAYVFEYDADGDTWLFDAKLVPQGGDGGDHFSHQSLAICGDTIVVGMFKDDFAGYSAGSVRVFVRDGDSWSETELRSSDIAPSDHFGLGVDIDGDVLVAGAQGDDDLADASGAAYVFRRSNGAWTEEAKLVADEGQYSDAFGRRVALSGDRIVCGARWEDAGCSHGHVSCNAGAAYVFERSGSVWSLSLKLIASDAQAGDEFGDSLALDGATCLVGAFSKPAGSVYFYDLDCLAAIERYCFCHDGAPCGNTDPVAGCANSTGSGARLTPSWSSSNSVARDNLVLTARRIPSHQFGLIYLGANQVRVPFGDGLRAVHPGPPGFGYQRLPAQNSGAAGTLQAGPGLVEYWTSHWGGAGTITSGSTWNFQAYYRDPAGPCGFGFNLSNAVSVTFAP